MDFHDVYERHAPSVLRFASGLTGDPALAQDLTSEAFVRLWTTSGEIRLETVRAYLFTIVRNLYRSDLRRSWRAAPLDDNMPDPIDRVADPVERRSQLAAALRALKQLPVGDREALLCTLLPFTSVHLEDRLTFFMFWDMPWSRALWAVAAVLWFAHARLHRGARAAGL